MPAFYFAMWMSQNTGVTEKVHMQLKFIKLGKCRCFICMAQSGDTYTSYRDDALVLPCMGVLVSITYRSYSKLYVSFLLFLTDSR